MTFRRVFMITTLALLALPWSSAQAWWGIGFGRPRCYRPYGCRVFVAPVVVAPPPVVYVQPAPVCVQPIPVAVQPAPVPVPAAPLAAPPPPALGSFQNLPSEPVPAY